MSRVTRGKLSVRKSACARHVNGLSSPSVNAAGAYPDLLGGMDKNQKRPGAVHTGRFFESEIRCVFRLEPEQVEAENAVKSRSFPCKKTAKSLPFAPFLG